MDPPHSATPTSAHPDGVQGTINLTNEGSLNYVPPESVRRVMSGSGAEISLYRRHGGVSHDRSSPLYWSQQVLW
jgi:hypothetical protein